MAVQVILIQMQDSFALSSSKMFVSDNYCGGRPHLWPWSTIVPPGFPKTWKNWQPGGLFWALGQGVKKKVYNWQQLWTIVVPDD